MVISPMMAHGSFPLDPQLKILLFAAAALWTLALLIVIPNALLSCRSGKSAVFKLMNLGFLAVYVSLAAVLFSGVVFSVDLLWGIILTFAIPTMSGGHFIYLYIGRRKERNLQKQGNEVKALREEI